MLHISGWENKVSLISNITKCGWTCIFKMVQMPDRMKERLNAAKMIYFIFSDRLHCSTDFSHADVNAYFYVFFWSLYMKLIHQVTESESLVEKFSRTSTRFFFSILTEALRGARCTSGPTRSSMSHEAPKSVFLYNTSTNLAKLFCLVLILS